MGLIHTQRLPLFPAASLLSVLPLFPCMWNVFLPLAALCFFFFFFFIPECKQFDIMSYHVFFTFLPGVLRDFGFVGLYFSQIWKSFGHWFSKFSLPPPWGSSYMYSKYLMSHSWLIFCTYFLSLFFHLFYFVMSLDFLIFYSICS